MVFPKAFGNGRTIGGGAAFASNAVMFVKSTAQLLSSGGGAAGGARLAGEAGTFLASAASLARAVPIVLEAADGLIAGQGSAKLLSQAWVAMEARAGGGENLTEGAGKAGQAVDGGTAPTPGRPEVVVHAPSQARGGTYVLPDPATGQVMRAGRTNDPARRQLDHARDPALRDLEFELAHRTDVYAEQRGLEQLLHEPHIPPLNRIGGIGSRNPKLPEYRDAARKFLENQQGGP